MAYDYEKKPGEYYISYPHYALQFVESEKAFKNYLVAYLKTNEPTSIAVGVTEDLRLVCKENPENTRSMVSARRDVNKANKSKAKPKKGGKK